MIKTASSMMLAVLIALVPSQAPMARRQPVLLTDHGDSIVPVDSLTQWQPDSMVRVDSVPAVYAQWWMEISACSNLQGYLQKITWWRVVDVRLRGLSPTSGLDYFRCPTYTNNPYCSGWWNGRHSIFLKWSGLYEERLVKHEMLHELLGTRNPAMNKPHNKLFKKCRVAA